ncbi:MAG TPA: ATP-binding protein [Acidimicrobiia bacterium]|nr:ATP-binding protein [Acidimicrobiia bacterium]
MPFHDARLVAVTGGPGAGKTAVLELAARSLCEHVAILPEAATIVFGGGFPRHQTQPGLRAAQRAIYRVQREVEKLVIEERQVAVALCDRGTVDGLAYWPDPVDTFWEEIGSNLQAELSRYHAVVHLRTPSPDQGYHTDPTRNEPAERAAELDRRIAAAWKDHPTASWSKPKPTSPPRPATPSS